MNLKSDITISYATIEDIPSMVTLLQQLFAIEKDFNFNEKRHAFGLQMLIESKNSFVFIAKFKGKSVGMITLQTLISTVSGAKSALLEDFVVDKNFTALGIGSLLFEHIKAFAYRHKFKRFQLVCDEDNTIAQTFYTKKSFKKSNLKAWYCSLE